MELREYDITINAGSTVAFTEILNSGWKKVYVLYEDNSNHTALVSISDQRVSIMNFDSSNYFGLTNNNAIQLYVGSNLIMMITNNTEANNAIFIRELK